MASDAADRAARRTFHLGLAALALATLVAFAPVLAAGFLVIDDPGYVTANPRVLGGPTLDALTWAVTSTDAANWHPLAWISHQIDVALFGLDPRGHHAVSLLLHVANALLAALALERLTGSPRRALLAAALFALHPLRVESVAWIAERKDVLSATFYLAALLAYLAWVRRGGGARYAALLLAAAAAMASKPMAVTLPCLLLLLDAAPLGRLFRAPGRALVEKLPLFAMAAATSAATLAAQSSAGAVARDSELSLGARLANAVVAPFDYLARTFWPFDLSVLYPHPGLPGGAPRAPLAVALATIALALFVGAALRSLRRGRPLESPVATGGLWFLGLLVPVAGLVQVGEQATADRYTYLPHVGLFLALVWAAADLARRWRLPARPSALATLALLALLAARTSAEARVWRDSPTLLAASLAATPDNPMLLWLAGREALAAGDVADAEARVTRALELRPIFVEARETLALVYLAQRRDREAASQLDIALRLHPRYLPALRDLAELRWRQGDLPAAAALLARARAVAPRDAGLALRHGQALELAGDREAAATAYRDALALDPGRPDAAARLRALATP